MRKHAHITINGRPLCSDSSMAAADRAKAAQRANTGADLPAIVCGHGSVKDARRVAQALRPFFKRGVKVEAVTGSCPELAL